MSNACHQQRSVWRLAEALEQLSKDRTFIEVADFAGELSVELYKPIGVDEQSPHARDELYVIVSGSGSFTLCDDQFPFGAGDVIFVPAHAEHRFSSFTDDFSTWVIFFGADKPA